MKGIIKAASKSEFYIEENCFITELINSAETPKFSISKARVEVGASTEAHAVRDTDEVYYILSGSGEMEINGAIVGTAEPGDLVFIPQNAKQCIRNTGNEDLVFLCICTPRFEMGNYQAL